MRRSAKQVCFFSGSAAFVADIFLDLVCNAGSPSFSRSLSVINVMASLCRRACTCLPALYMA